MTTLLLTRPHKLRLSITKFSRTSKREAADIELSWRNNNWITLHRNISWTNKRIHAYNKLQKSQSLMLILDGYRVNHSCYWYVLSRMIVECWFFSWKYITSIISMNSSSHRIQPLLVSAFRPYFRASNILWYLVTVWFSWMSAAHYVFVARGRLAAACHIVYENLIAIFVLYLQYHECFDNI